MWPLQTNIKSLRLLRQVCVWTVASPALASTSMPRDSIAWTYCRCRMYCTAGHGEVASDSLLNLTQVFQVFQEYTPTYTNQNSTWTLLQQWPWSKGDYVTIHVAICCHSTSSLEVPKLGKLRRKAFANLPQPLHGSGQENPNCQQANPNCGQADPSNNVGTVVM